MIPLSTMIMITIVYNNELDVSVNNFIIVFSAEALLLWKLFRNQITENQLVWNRRLVIHTVARKLTATATFFQCTKNRVTDVDVDGFFFFLRTVREDWHVPATLKFWFCPLTVNWHRLLQMSLLTQHYQEQMNTSVPSKAEDDYK